MKDLCNVEFTEPIQMVYKALGGLSHDQCMQFAQAVVNFSNARKNISQFQYFCLCDGKFYPSSFNSFSSNSWILDSGATYHTAHDSSLFTHTNPSAIPSMSLPIGSAIPIGSTGTILFNKDIKLDHVLHVPSFRLNIISASKITKSLNCYVIFFLDYCVIQDLAMGRMIGWG